VPRAAAHALSSSELVESCIERIEALRPHVRLVEVDLPFEMEEVVGLYMTLAVGVIGAVLPKPLEVLAKAQVRFLRAAVR
jgi:hypothetical protein